METVKLKMKPFRIDFFQIALLKSGGGKVSSDGREFSLGAYTLFFTLPGQIIYWDVPNNWEGYYLCIEESFYTIPVEEYRRLFDFPFFKTRVPAINLEEEEGKLILELMKKVNWEYSNPSVKTGTIIKAYLSTILSYSLRFHERNLDHTRAKNQVSPLSVRFKDEVNERLKDMVSGTEFEPISVSKLADQLFVTPKYLSEAIKKDLGVTPTDHINSRIIQEAQKLLSTTELQAKEIAYILGFRDSSYFNRLFKKLVDVSPGQFRKSLK
ncbi:MAG: AraC family transcriptional regulator [Bacteroidota bacterium]